MAAILKIKADYAADQRRGRLAGIQQLQESIMEMEEDFEKEVLERVFQGHMKKLSEYAWVEDQERSNLEDVTTHVQRTLTREAALQLYLQELNVGGDGFLMRPHPQMNHWEETTLKSEETVTITALLCAICDEAFPHGDLLFCSCHHVYHPWCAAQWFKFHSSCAI